MPDNPRSAVSVADKWSPTLTDGLNDLATHYGCCTLPARVRRPKDKALVEDAVHKSYMRIYAPMHNRVFHSLQELNDAVAGLLEQYNSRRMQGCDYSRVERFLAVEKPELLSAQRYQMKRHALLTIAPNSFIQLGRERHHYSVPSRLIANKVEVIFTDTQVRIFHSGTCVATHMRSFKQGGYTWVKEHLPSQSLLCLYMTTSEDHKHTSDISYQLLKRHINGKSLSDLKAIRLPSMARTWQNLMEAHRTDSISLTDGMRLLIQGENDMRMSNRTHRLIKNSTI